MQDETKKYEEILKKMKDYDENISKERVAKEYAEKERRRLEVSCIKDWSMICEDGFIKLRVAKPHIQIIVIIAIIWKWTLAILNLIKPSSQIFVNALEARKGFFFHWLSR